MTASLTDLVLGRTKQRTRIAISVFAGGSGTREGLAADAIELDTTLTESYAGGATVTDHPVEEGSDITDHVRRNPETVDITGWVSNYPIVFLRSISTPGAAVGAQPVLPGTNRFRRAEAAFEFLRGIKDAGLTVDVITTLRTYENFAITSLTVSRDKDSRNILDLGLSLREVQVAITEQVEAPEVEDPSRKGRTDRGRKPKTEPPAPAAESGSQLFELFSGFGG